MGENGEHRRADTRIGRFRRRGMLEPVAPVVVVDPALVLDPLVVPVVPVPDVVPLLMPGCACRLVSKQLFADIPALLDMPNALAPLLPEAEPLAPVPVLAVPELDVPLLELPVLLPEVPVLLLPRPELPVLDVPLPVPLLC